jgi:hypothetical protein
MRVKDVFSVFPRKLRSGKVVYYYQCYDDNDADNCRKMVRNQILPYFGKTRLDKIASENINNWLLGFKERKVSRAGRGYPAKKVFGYPRGYR